jgi:hypothetical protein
MISGLGRLPQPVYIGNGYARYFCPRWIHTIKATHADSRKVGFSETVSIGNDIRACRQLSVKSASRSVDRSALGGACSLEQTEQDVTEIERSGQQTQAGSEAIGIDILERRFNIAVTLLPDRDRGCE